MRVLDTYLWSVRIWLLIPAFLSLAPPSLVAQRDAATASGRTPRRVILAIVGAIVGGTGTALLNRESSGDSCRACYIAGGALAGGIAGLFIGREFDQMYAIRYRGVPRLRIPFVEAALDGDPVALTARDTLLAVATSTGVTLFTSTTTLLPRGRRAGGIRGISALELTAPAHALAVATPTGLYLYPPARGPGALLREGTIQAASASEDHLFFASGSRIEWAPLIADSARAWPGVELPAPVTDLEWDGRRRLLWALTDTFVVALEVTDSVRMLTPAPLPAGARSLAVQGEKIAVALGTSGTVILETSDPSRPREIGRWTAARFVYDVGLAGERLYAGAGPEGIFVIDLSGSTPRTIGLAFDLGFAATLLSRDGYTYILDRRTSSVRRIITPTR
jgi:hypothetical protein